MQGGVVLERTWFGLPGWVPEAARRYLLHTEWGLSIRALARGEGAHASTVLRQVRRVETRRDDPLVDEALRRLVLAGRPDAGDAGDMPRLLGPEPEDDESMICETRSQKTPITAQPDAATIEREARRILRRLSESGAILAVSPELDRAVVLRTQPDGRSTRTAVMERPVAEAFALKEWIERRGTLGRVATYEITASGRAALKRFLADDAHGKASPDRFGEQHRQWAERDIDDDTGEARRIRYNAMESPLAALARRREKDGSFFLAPELVAAGERLREDFELAQMGPRVAQNWDRFLTAGVDRGQFGAAGPGGGPEGARARVAAALADLGPGLGDMALRVCCFLEGLEAAEKRMGWSARSGKIVLRIALLRLRRHYDEIEGRYGALIG